MKTYAKISLLTVLLPLVACHKDAVEDEDYCLNPAYKVPLEVVVNLDPSFREYHTIDSVFMTRSSDKPYLKYYVAAYPMTSGLPTVVKSSLDNRMQVSIHPGRYTMVGWVMYESDDKTHGYNFYDDDFSELLLKNKYNYTGADQYKVAYRAAEAKNIAYNTPSTSLKAVPAMGHYKIIATDTASFKPDKVVISYSSMLPAAIHAKSGRINWWWDDISYSSQVTPMDSVGDLLASDFVLSQDNKETRVMVTVEVYDDAGKLRARKKNVEIPLVNGGITTVKGNFYSVLDLDSDATAGSGISIKTDWDATFDIEI